MPHVTPGCELRFYGIGLPSKDNTDNTLDSVVFDFEVVKTAPSIKTDVNCEVNDEQFPRLRAYDFYLEAPRISEKAINGLILQWMQGRRKIVRAWVTNTKTFSYDMIFENVDKTDIQSESELLQIPFINDYHICLLRLRVRLASVCNGLGDRLLVYMGLDYCVLEDPYAEKMSRTYMPSQNLLFL